MIETIFWICALLLGHTYVIYPWTLKILTDLKNKNKVDYEVPKSWPKISLVFSAYNEANILRQKIENLLALDYPTESLEILIGSDGSSDDTHEILNEYKDQFKLFLFEENRGKAAVLNDLKKEITGEILVFCDANTFFLPNALKVLSLPFYNNPKMGCVSGRLILQDSGKNALGEGESLYWQIESKIKELEGQLNILMGVNGAIYAIKPDLYVSIPEAKKITDDFFVSVNTLLNNHQCTYIKQAIGSETTSKSSMGEFHRKVRISQANFNFLKSYLPLLNPFKPLISYSFFSHKFLRWFSPHLILTLWISNGIILTPNISLINLIFVVQNVIYLLAFIGWMLNRSEKRLAITSLPFYFIAMNLALFFGFFQAIFNSQGGGWERIERDD